MQSIIVTTIYLLSILIPLTFTTINSELFEFPKFILLISGTLVITIAWALHIIKNRDFKIFPTTHVWIGYSSLLFLATQSLATIFSINPYTSFWGYYSRFHGGLLTTICYTIIYFAAAKWLDTKSTQKLIKISVGTAIIISLYAIAERFGIDKNFWVQDVQSRPFSTLGQPNWLSAYLIPNIFLALYLAQTIRSKNNSLLHYFVFVTLLIALLFTRSRSGLVAFALSFITYWLLLARQFSLSKLKNHIFIYFAVIAVMTFLIGTPYSRTLASYFSGNKTASPMALSSGTVLENGGTESGDIRKIVWTGALNLIKKYPLLGTGPETFAYTYYWMRPLAHNLTSEWDFLYNKAHNEYLNIAAGAGIIGLLAYLYFHLTILLASFTNIPKTKKVNQDENDALRHLYPVLGASVVAFTITNFFGFSVIPVYLMIIIVSVLPSGLQNKNVVFPSSLEMIYPLVILSIFALAYPIHLFTADISYSKGKRYLDAGSLSQALPLLQQAVKARPGLDLYHSTLGEAYAMSGQKDLALKEVELNKKLNPYHLNFFKSRAKIYLTLASLDPSYHLQASQELIEARKLSPTDPKLAYNLGLIYTRLDKADLAAKELNEAIALKPNYQEPYYALTLLYEQTKQVDKIPALLTSAKSNLATYSAQLKEKINKYSN